MYSICNANNYFATAAALHTPAAGFKPSNRKRLYECITVAVVEKYNKVHNMRAPTGHDCTQVWEAVRNSRHSLLTQVAYMYFLPELNCCFDESYGESCCYCVPENPGTTLLVVSCFSGILRVERIVACFVNKTLNSAFIYFITSLTTLLQ